MTWRLVFDPYKGGYASGFVPNKEYDFILDGWNEPRRFSLKDASPYFNIWGLKFRDTGITRQRIMNVQKTNVSSPIMDAVEQINSMVGEIGDCTVQLSLNADRLFGTIPCEEGNEAQVGQSGHQFGALSAALNQLRLEVQFLRSAVERNCWA